MVRKSSMYWFTADEHYRHRNLIEKKYTDRPFQSIEENDAMLIANHNSVVGENDITIHAGDFTLWKKVAGIYKEYINKLNGKHIFLMGSHDYWLKGKNNDQIWEKNIFVNGKKYYFVVCHYNMRTWAKSHYNSFQLYGHSHGRLEPTGKQHDIGVDNNDYYPVSATQIIDIMKTRDDNFNLIRKGQTTGRTYGK